MADIVEINSLKELESYRLAWNALLPQTPRASFFHTFDWFANYWKHFGHEREMRVLVVRAFGMPIGIVPLVVQHERYHIGNVRVLTYPLSDWGSWYGPIGPNQSVSMFMALKHIRDTRREWDLVDLRWIEAERSDRAGTGRALRAAGWNPRQNVYQETSSVRMGEQDWGAYFASRPKKWRHETRRQFRALQRSGEVSFERHRPAPLTHGDGDPRWDLFDECVAVSRNSWQAQVRNGNTLCHPQVEEFIRDSHAVAAKLGMLDVALLRLNGKPAAFQYSYVYDGAVSGLRMGYDRHLNQQGAGNIVLTSTLEDSFKRGDKAFELGAGDFPFKRRVRTHVETSYRFTCYPWLAWRAQGVRLTQWLKARRAAMSLS